MFVAASAPAAAAESMLGAMAAAIGPTEARRAMTGLATRADCTGPRGAFTTEMVSHGDVVRFVQVRDSGRTALLVDRHRGVRARFTRYHDMRVPAIAVSNDGSLGWLACEIEAEGQEVAPQGQGTRVAYAFSWIETAIKRNGRWLRNGNASSARP